jgi:hypothetical protein
LSRFDALIRVSWSRLIIFSFNGTFMLTIDYKQPWNQYKWLLILRSNLF